MVCDTWGIFVHNYLLFISWNIPGLGDGVLNLCKEILYMHADLKGLCLYQTTVSLKQCFFYRFIYETEHHNGIAELLEILGR